MGNDLMLRFEVLDRPAQLAFVSMDKEPTLDQAVQNMKNSVESGSFSIRIRTRDSPSTTIDKTYVADKSSFKSAQYLYVQEKQPASGYSNGSFAALCLSMLVIGTLASGGATYYAVFKRGMFF